MDNINDKIDRVYRYLFGEIELLDLFDTFQEIKTPEIPKTQNKCILCGEGSDEVELIHSKDGWFHEECREQNISKHHE